MCKIFLYYIYIGLNSSIYKSFSSTCIQKPFSGIHNSFSDICKCGNI